MICDRCEGTAKDNEERKTRGSMREGTMEDDEERDSE
jgi:hypothetical protein